MNVAMAHAAGRRDSQGRLSAFGRVCRTGLAIVVSLAGVAACGAAVSTPTPVAETMTIDVQQETAPFVQEMADSFAAGRAGLTIVLNQTDGAEPLARLRQGKAELATTVTSLDGEHSGWLQAEIARQPIGVILHPDNPVKNLTLDDLGNIYTGRVTDWKTVGGPGMPIMVLAREPAATLRQRMDTILIWSDSRLTPNALILPSDEAMIATVSRRPEAIGYIIGAGPNNSIKTVSVQSIQFSFSSAVGC